MLEANGGKLKRIIERPITTNESYLSETIRKYMQVAAVSTMLALPPATLVGWLDNWFRGAVITEIKDWAGIDLSKKLKEIDSKLKKIEDANKKGGDAPFDELWDRFINSIKNKAFAADSEDVLRKTKESLEKAIKAGDQYAFVNNAYSYLTYYISFYLGITGLWLSLFHTRRFRDTKMQTEKDLYILAESQLELMEEVRTLTESCISLQENLGELKKTKGTALPEIIENVEGIIQINTKVEAQLGIKPIDVVDAVKNSTVEAKQTELEDLINNLVLPQLRKDVSNNINKGGKGIDISPWREVIRNKMEMMNLSTEDEDLDKVFEDSIERLKKEFKDKVPSEYQIIYK